MTKLINNYKYNLKDHLFLFDIDGTILDSSGYGKKAFILAFEKKLNVKIDSDINFLGGIDNLIFKNLYRSYNLPIELLNKKWKEFKKEYIKNLSEFSKKYQWKLYQNVDYTIKLLTRESNIGLVTGNIKKGAYIKLKKFGFDNYFSCGGFGDTVQTRDTLVKEAIDNCMLKYKTNFDPNKIYLFGDTQIDIESAKSNNINPVLIDPKNQHNENSKKWAVKFHGSFQYIEIFLYEININSVQKEILYFC